MAYSIIEKFNKLVRKISTVTLCSALIFTGFTFIEGMEPVHAESETGIAWTRVSNDKQMLQFKDAMNSGDARILMVYHDKYYLGDSTGISGHKYSGRIVPSAFKLDQDYFVTRKTYNTPTVTYAGRDRDNNVSKYTIRLRDSNDKSGKMLLMHREWDYFIVPYTDYFLTFQVNKGDNQSKEEAWNCTSSDRFDDPGFMFSAFSTAFDRQYFLEKRLAKDYNGQKLSELSDDKLKTIKAQVDKDINTAYTIGCLRKSTSDIDSIYKTLQKKKSELSEDMIYMENVKPTNQSDKAYQTKLAAYQIEAAELDEEWSKYRDMADKYSDLYTDEEWYLADDGKTSLFYNISGEFDLMIGNNRFDENDSVLRATGYDWNFATQFDIYIGVPIELPTLSQNLELESNTTYTFEDVTVATDDIFKVPFDSTVILKGTVLNYGLIQVEGTLILDEGCILTDDTRISYKDYQSVNVKTIEHEVISGYSETITETGIRRGSIEVNGGFVYVRKGAALVQHARPKLSMNSLSSMLIDGAVLIDGVLELNGGGRSCDIEIGPTGRLGYGCYVNWDKYGDEPNRFLADLVSDAPLSTIVRPQLSNNLECNMDASATIHNYGSVELFSGANDKERIYNIDSGAKIYGYEGHSKPFSSKMSGITKTIIK